MPAQGPTDFWRGTPVEGRPEISWRDPLSGEDSGRGVLKLVDYDAFEYGNSAFRAVFKRISER